MKIIFAATIIGLAACTAVVSAPSEDIADATVKIPDIGADPGLRVSAFVTGEALLKQCAEGDHSCVGYILGAIDEMEWRRDVDLTTGQGSGRVLHPCVPEDITGQEVVELVATFINDNPGLKEVIASAAVRVALLAKHGEC